jgi:EAL domain-containing protein (putative c-di-GMP-specific phosphodiesterase class I)
VSAGVAFYPTNGTEEQTLIRNADIAMHNAKRERNEYKFFSQSMNSRVDIWVKTVSELHQAMEEHQFEMFFQPQIDARTEVVIGAEALIRWHHPENGMVGPDKFITVAEDTGLIWQLGETIIEQCCEAVRLLNTHLAHNVRIAINISPKQFQKNDLKSLLLKYCDQYGIKTDQIELEITEGLLMENTDRSEAIMQDLVKEGFAFSIDDFGTGYSSLAYLRRFPITTLKVDRSFVMDLPKDADASALSRAIIHLAHSLRLDVVAEGVETAEQLEFLKDEGCEFIQGYYFSKPLPLDELLPWIKTFSEK